MPGSDGKLTKEELETANTWLKDNWKNWACPFSGHTNWNLADSLSQMNRFTGAGLVVGGPVFPMLVLTCTGCGYTALVNAVMAGIVSPSTPAKAVEEEDKDASK